MIIFSLFAIACKDHPKSIKQSQEKDSLIREQEKPRAITIKDSDSVTIDKNLLVGKVNFSKNENFELVPKDYSSKEIYVRKETLKAFLEMANQAEKEGVHLKIISGARSFDHQKAIWERKWNSLSEKDPHKKALKILTFSSMPMTSRHHWGTDIDLNSLENSYFEKGEGLKIYKWLTQNAYKYGFCQVYTDKNADDRTGYEMEKWHWSFIPISGILLKEYNKSINYSDFNGFLGSEVSKDINVIENYVNGISIKCSPIKYHEI